MYLIFLNIIINHINLLKKELIRITFTYRSWKYSLESYLHFYSGLKRTTVLQIVACTVHHFCCDKYTNYEKKLADVNI